MSSEQPPTKLVYQYEETLRSYPTRVTASHRYDDLPDDEKNLFKANERAPEITVIETKETIFYAQGGGQPFDIGYMHAAGKGRFHVEAVRSVSGGRILHFGSYKPHTEQPLGIGDMVDQHIDSARRDFNSRSHTAGHIVSLAVLRLAETDKELKIEDGKASHIPDASWVEFKGIIDGKYKESIEAQSNNFVEDTLPVKLYWARPDELEKKGVLLVPGMPVLTGADGLARVVDIVGAGAYPCGGTHTQDTSLVGRITIKGIKRQKGNSKVSYTIS